ncbi:MAG: altronate dehydratase family protein, partial [Pirellulaceae bacterium]|nr:altronate dehydratase family protein [Pirellulaceae bacterium]
MPANPVDAIFLHPDDNICVAARPLQSGDRIDCGGATIEVAEPIKMGHKIATVPIGADEPVRKYGQIIGFTTQPVAAGDHVHVHNVVTGTFALDYAPSTEIPDPPEPITDRTFMGIRRKSGRAGTRNYIAIISSVNCSASVGKYIAQRFDERLLADFPNIDGVISLSHGYGCGMEWDGLQHTTLNRVLGGMARHPNVGGYLLVGLGCEQASIGHLIQQQALVQIDGVEPAARPLVLSMQDQGGTTRTVDDGVRMLSELMPAVNDVRREPVPVSELILGTECGGSDGNSGVTANPAVGVASDLLVAAGATSILAETTEIYGAEHLLTRRARTPAVAQKLLDRIDWWKWYVGLFGGEMDNNPSVGNKEGGLTTIAEKSLGAVAKGGSTALEDVYEYAEPVTARGFVVMDTPGFDPPSVTGMVAGGATVNVFTTGRGSCFGCKPSPSIKIASNTPMYQRMADDMDINAGEILAGRSIESVGREIFEKII